MICINSTLVTDNLTNFPIYISISSDDIKKARPDGYDFVFVSSDAKTKYNHEIEKWDNNSGEFLAWVNITSLSSTNDTVLFLYYGYDMICVRREYF